MEITYQDVFGVQPGEEVQESHGRNWRPCPAVVALRSLLGSYTDVFPGRKLGGRSGYWNEFNRHHAGLAVDIMLDPNIESEVKLGENLFMLFMRMRSTMSWLGILYQHVSLNNLGHVGNYRPTDHMNHIHIDWHGGSRNVTWFSPIQFIPFRKIDGTLLQLRPKRGDRIASVIRWSDQAMTDFRQNLGLRQGLDDLVGRHRRGELQRVNLAQEAGLVG